MDMVDIYIGMVIYMKDNGVMIWKMGMEDININKKDKFMKDSLLII